MNIKKLLKYILLGCCLVLFAIYLANKTIINNAKEKVFTTTQNIPKNKVGLLLGTVKYLSNGRINLYYQFRVEATVKLYKAGKIDYILISGDNGSKNYDEPTDFKDDLVKYGIPEDRIFLDYAGFRTLDSVVRAKEIFGQSSLTIISQKFHNERAIYLAEHFGIEVVGFNAKGISGRYGLKVQLREYLARVKLFIDLLIGKQPKFLGKKIKIE